MNIEIVVADYLDEQHGRDISYLLNCYANDPMGGGASLPSYVMENLVPELAKISSAFSLICYVDNRPAGLANCFDGFSTFKCKPLINIHDLVVLDDYRGQGVCLLMLTRVEELAKEKGCCKITLEVLEGNKPAKNAYLKFGFAGYEMGPSLGNAQFWQKNL